MPMPPRLTEPYRVKTVEPIAITSLHERRHYLEQAGYNLFAIPADRVTIDLITDSGTGAMSSRQWAAMMRGDESYAGSASYHRLVEAIERITGFNHVLPTHQGRISDRLLVEAVIGFPGAGTRAAGDGLIVPNNAHFDTTRLMIERSGAHAINLLTDGADDPNAIDPFKGDMDPRKLEEMLRGRGDDVPFVMLTLTCNSNGGQPVSLQNMRTIRRICDQYGKMLILDSCRFAENAWFIRVREQNQSSRSIAAIVRDMFDLCDGAVMSTRKDALCNCGGLLLLRDERLFRKACGLCVMTDGFQMTYGSLPARDLEAIAVGMDEVMDELYLSSRVGQVERLAARLESCGVRTVKPAGGHAVHIDAEAFVTHVHKADHPAHALACAIYEFGGVRCTRIGSVLRNPRTGEPLELVRLAIPRRTYMQSHLDYVAEVIIELKARAHEIKPIRTGEPMMIRREEPVLAS
jgi:tryptophanase